ncbi:hypothetical protein CORT_0F01380 [Candida orthopsilosis Co 90-125]|uniref:MPN domain-containing protein n=1 Tax=Candida orthopsilosis (strain 90-125) TaxID=1136231 RepID=H8X966_CANO9|nr:hypothetical protein CORT_0F01380 [Candida orthopsilosis Co 90-125]CCG24365.1 hypothetical protein CORT_0F01380 [Candida orthopsilosis Co 90-125]
MATETSNSFMHLVRPNVLAPAAGSANGPAKVKIHASALLTILEIVAKQVLNKRIIGTLLGIRSDNGLEVEIRDAFMVPCDETGDSIAIEDQAHKSLFHLYKKSHPKESVLGWFGSMNEIDDTTSLIHDFYSKGVDRAFPYPAIYLNVEYINEQGQITSPKIITYIGAAVGKSSAAAKASVQVGWNKPANVNNSYIFTPIPNEVVDGTNTEKLAYKSLQKSTIDNNTNISSIIDGKHPFFAQNLQQVQSNVANLIKYIDANASTTSSQSDENLDLLRKLSNTLLTKPPILTDVEELNKLFDNFNQDVIMIEYLTKAVKDQIELSARLTASSEADKRN